MMTLTKQGHWARLSCMGGWAKSLQEEALLDNNDDNVDNCGEDDYDN